MSVSRDIVKKEVRDTRFEVRRRSFWTLQKSQFDKFLIRIEKKIEIVISFKFIF